MSRGSRTIVMLGTRFDTMGGISAVVNVYRVTGLFDRRGIKYLATHRDGHSAMKLRAMAFAWVQFMSILLTGRLAILHIHISFRASFWRKQIGRAHV